MPTDNLPVSVDALQPVAAVSEGLILHLVFAEHNERIAGKRRLPEHGDIEAVAHVPQQPSDSALVRAPSTRIRPSLPVPFVPIKRVIGCLEPREPVGKIAIVLRKERENRCKKPPDDRHDEADGNKC